MLDRRKRFLADVELPGGERVVAHLANTGRMTGCWEPGCAVRVWRSDDPKRKLAWSVEQTRVGGHWILVNTARANAIVGEALRDGRIGGLDAREVRPEAPFPGGGRADFLLDGQTWVEVKNVTLLEGRRLLFPDTVSERATRHLGELRAAVERGERAVLLLHVGREGGEEVSAAAHIDPVWAETLTGAMDAGLEVQAWRSALDAAGATLVERLPFTSPGR
ncbi:MAG: DNA/RNA nuclease SfsA [Alphaproteobacteria bacterium]|nr:DNA/RNA nuclease SfsA [Alphaproteobacteria bacterium]MCB9692132.1 DNA/RNA nuclease SfsA [Alphaproteobacteria bacterium]